MAALKDELSPALVRALAAEVARAHPGFDARAFAAEATAGLEDLELMARARHIAAALARRLPSPIDDWAPLVERALGSPAFDGWLTLPCTLAVAEAGIERPDAALPLLARLTPRWSSEFALRPFLARHPEVTLAHLRAWAGHPDEHVRRLVSEGTRPRLPWAARVAWLVEDPGPGLELAGALREDPSEYVRRSVGNHLNDVSRDHPRLAVATARKWLAGAGPGAERAVRRGLRTLVARGDSEALALLGADPAAPVRLERLAIAPPSAVIGESVTIEAVLAAEAPALVVAHYVVHHAGARGARRGRPFLLGRAALEPGRPARLARTHAFRQLSVRRLHPGPHRIEVQVNGRILGAGSVDLRAPG